MMYSDSCSWATWTKGLYKDLGLVKELKLGQELVNYKGLKLGQELVQGAGRGRGRSRRQPGRGGSRGVLYRGRRHRNWGVILGLGLANKLRLGMMVGGANAFWLG